MNLLRTSYVWSLRGERPLVQGLALAEVEPGARPVLEEAVAQDLLPLQVEALSGSWHQHQR